MITSVYKPPAEDFSFTDPVPQVQSKPQIIIGDFNSHTTQWGYMETNKDGEAVEEWMDTNQLSLTHDAKETATIHEEYVIMFESDPFAEETISTGEKVMESISQKRQKTWNSLLESTDMSKNSKKAWSLIRKLRGDPKAAP